MRTITCAMIAIPAVVTGALGGYGIVPAGQEQPPSAIAASVSSWTHGFETDPDHKRTSQDWRNEKARRESLRESFGTRPHPDQVIGQLDMATWTASLDQCRASLTSPANNGEWIGEVTELFGQIRNFETNPVEMGPLNTSRRKLAESVADGAELSASMRQEWAQGHANLAAAIDTAKTKVHEEESRLRELGEQHLKNIPRDPDKMNDE